MNLDHWQSTRVTHRPARKLVAIVAGVAAAGVIYGQAAQATRAHKADIQQGIAACDIAWQQCRAALGKPVPDAHGCTWKQFEDSSWKFVQADGKGGWDGCEFNGEPDEDASEDDGPCGVGWNACYSTVVENE
jgi:hypothetical protein